MANDKKRNKAKPFNIDDFHIEFIGCLIPGIMFTVFATVIMAACFESAMLLILGLPNNESPGMAGGAWRYLSNMTTGNGFGIYGNLALLIAVSYAFGSILFRKEHNKPDYASAKAIWAKLDGKERARFDVRPRPDISAKRNCGKVAKVRDYLVEEDVQFPYHFLKEYLIGRGLDHLVEWVPWEGSDPKTYKYRTRMFIDNLKIRLRYLVPGRCKDITKNEAHSRMATSIWYACSLLLYFSFFSLCVSMFAYVRLYFLDNGYHQECVSLYVIINIIMCTSSMFMRRFVVTPIHNMRRFEVINVLEVANCAEMDGYKLRYPKSGTPTRTL